MIRKIQLVVVFIFLGLNLMADPPNPDGAGSGDGGALPGGGAPVDGGTIIFLAMAASYAAHKTYQLKFKKPGYTVVG